MRKGGIAVDPITSVMRAMTDAVSNVKLATLSMAVTRQARGKGEEEGMDRATGFAADSLPSAIQASQASQAALIKAQQEAQAQESLHWQQLKDEAEAAARALDRARMRQALKEARAKAQEADEPGEDGGGQGSGEADSSKPDERRADRITAEPGGEPALGDGAAEKGVVYTHLGGVKPKATDKKLTVTA